VDFFTDDEKCEPAGYGARTEAKTQLGQCLHEDGSGSSTQATIRETPSRHFRGFWRYV
jgi:hypothetical protein